MEFKYCVNPNDEEPIMLINKHIGFDEAKGQGIIGSEFQKELLFLDSLGKKRIKIYMSTLGGSVLEGQLIYNSILKSVCKVDTYNIGVVASIGVPIFGAGRTRYMCDYALLMLHNTSGGTSQAQDILKQSVCTMVASRVGKTEQEVSDIISR